MRLIYILASIIYMLVISNSYSQQLENLGENVNTEIDEISPVISPDGQTLYFVKSKTTDSKFYQNAWFTNLDNNGNFLPAKKLVKPFGSFDMYGVMSASPDGNQLLLFSK